MGLRL